MTIAVSVGLFKNKNKTSVRASVCSCAFCRRLPLVQYLKQCSCHRKIKLRQGKEEKKEGGREVDRLDRWCDQSIKERRQPFSAMGGVSKRRGRIRHGERNGNGNLTSDEERWGGACVVIIIANINEMHLAQVLCASGRGTNDVPATSSNCFCLAVLHPPDLTTHHSASPLFSTQFLHSKH